MLVDGRLVLIDWDTAALAPPERDLSLIATTGDDGVDRYQQAPGRELDPAVATLYRLRWYLDDLASAVACSATAIATPQTPGGGIRAWHLG
jgi:spectinomycin phosphotransferase